MIERKTPADLNVMMGNSQLLVGAIDGVERLFAPGVSTYAIDKAIEGRVLATGGVPAFKGYRGYAASSCMNINEEITNTPPSRRELRSGDLLKLQVGMLKDGFHTKIQHAYAIGDLSEGRRRLFLATKAALWAGIAEAKVDNHLGDIGWAIQNSAKANGFDVVREFVGHGIGKKLHEEPNVPGYGERGRGQKLAEGMVLQILPLILDGAPEIRMESAWSAVTNSGKDACLLGHVVAITHNGPRILTFSARDYGLDETRGEAVCILSVGSELRVFPLEDMGIHSIRNAETGVTIISGSAQVIQKRSGGFLRSQIDDFESLINKPDVRESEFQRFFELNPSFLLGSDYKSLRSRVILPRELGNDLIPDFFLEPIVGRLWDIAELKLPSSLLSAGRLNRERFAHSVYEACAQVRTYSHYFDDPRHRDFISDKYGILACKPRVSVIIGRKFEVSDLVRKQIELDLPWVRVVTYQDLLEKARQRLIV